MKHIITIEQDPITKDDGIIWFNTTENLLKIHNRNETDTILTVLNFQKMIKRDLVNIDRIISISFDDIMKMEIKHNQNNKNLIYSFFDEFGISFIGGMKIIDENTILIEFVDITSGIITIQFGEHK